MIYLWTEDKEGNVGYQFWETVSKELFDEKGLTASEKIRILYHNSDLKKVLMSVDVLGREQ